ncbi:MAG: hypothetical protein ACKO16_16055 [Gemmataceae bacterium]
MKVDSKGRGRGIQIIDELVPDMEIKLFFERTNTIIIVLSACFIIHNRGISLGCTINIQIFSGNLFQPPLGKMK